MDIERTTHHDFIELGNGITISVNSEAPDLTPAHTKVVDAIIEAVGKIAGFNEPTGDAIVDTGEGVYVDLAEADPKPEEPAGNSPASLGESAPNSKPRLLIDIATSTNSSERTMKAISLSFHHLYEAFDRDEERAMAFVECIASTKLDDVQVIPMNNDQVIMAEAFASHRVGNDRLVELAQQAIARVATAVAVDYVVSVR